MDRLKKNFFSNSKEKSNETPKSHPNIYCEGQIVNVNDPLVKEEREEVKTKENKRNLFSATYNMFF